ncbi:MAG: hypothetical protein RLZZ591_1517 [Pseudomonadota bacterium]|jgi:DNA-binding GntR family transcriptional regulator
MAKRPAQTPADLADAPGTGSRTLIERAYGQLREDILSGRLVAGQKLRVEHLKNGYTVSAGTLREALARLVSDALVVAEGQRGFTVAPMTVDELEDLTNLRVFIETAAIQEAIRCSNAAWRQQLTEAFASLSALEQPLLSTHFASWESANFLFHERLLQGGASPWTIRTLRQLTAHGERYRRLAIRVPGLRRDVHQEHQQIFDSAMAGQPARAALALEAHVRMTPDLLIKALREGQISLTESPQRTPPQP